MPGTLLVNKIGAATGTEISFETGHSMTFTTTQFKLTGGTAGQAITTDGSGNLTFADMTSDPTMGGDLTGTASNAQIAANAVGITELNVTDGTSGQALKTDGSGTMSFGDVSITQTPTAVSDQANTSTGYFDLPSGTTAQRPGSPANGNVRLNTTLLIAEIYNDGDWVSFAGSTPTISSIGPTTAAETGTLITVIGTNFQTGAVVKLIGTNSAQINAASTTVNSTTEIVFTTPVLTVALEPYDVKVTNINGGSATLDDALDAGGTPAWTTAAGNLGAIADDDTGTHFTLVATDPDGTAVTFAETTSALTTAGLSLNSTTGAISGDPTDVSSQTTYNFDVDASDSVNTTSRSFNITVNTASTVEFALLGAGGGGGGRNSSSYAVNNPTRGAGGCGALITATYKIISGKTLYFYVGDWGSGGPAGSASSNNNTYGGNGSYGGNDTSGEGGDFSGVFLANAVTVANVLLIAAGGGGGGGRPHGGGGSEMRCNAGGGCNSATTGEGNDGTRGGNAGTLSGTDDGAAEAGQKNAGGRAGTATGSINSAIAGLQWIGGNGSTSDYSHAWGSGGGGGGGLYGGGGGADDGSNWGGQGGGAGSSYIRGLITNYTESNLNTASSAAAYQTGTFTAQAFGFDGGTNVDSGNAYLMQTPASFSSYIGSLSLNDYSYGARDTSTFPGAGGNGKQGIIAYRVDGGAWIQVTTIGMTSITF